MWPKRSSNAAAVLAPKPGRPGKPSAVSPTSASQSGIDFGATPNFSRTPSASSTTSLRRSSCTTLPPTHWPRSLSGVQMIDCSTDFGAPRPPPRSPSASSASNSTIGHTVTPSASRRVFEQRELVLKSGSMPDPSLYGPEVVPERLDHVIARDAEVGRAVLEHRQHRLHDGPGRRRPRRRRGRGAPAGGRGTGGRARRFRRRGGHARAEPVTRPPRSPIPWPPVTDRLPARSARRELSCDRARHALGVRCRPGRAGVQPVPGAPPTRSTPPVDHRTGAAARRRCRARTTHRDEHRRIAGDARSRRAPRRRVPAPAAHDERTARSPGWRRIRRKSSTCSTASRSANPSRSWSRSAT